jgi:hypothetical protein
MAEWIACSERMPEEWTGVIIFAGCPMSACYPIRQEPKMIRCYKCGKPVEPSKAVALELSFVDNIFRSAGTKPEESQGWFDFGPDCGPKSDGKAVNAHRKWASA